jgi:hypothetical protein
MSTIRPLEIAAYLRSTGWQQTQAVPGRWSRWIKTGDFEVTLPLSQELGDYWQRLADVIGVLEVAEGRSRQEIITDLSTSASDILRFRLTGSEAEDGSIPIEEGAQIVQRVRDVMMAGACAAIERRSLFHTRKPGQALDYLKKVRLGQTERGSYVVTVISKVAPLLQTGVNLQGEHEEPYERQVTTTVSQALAAVKRATESAVMTGRFDEFQAAVGDGVSANLCDALRGLTQSGESDRGLEIGFSWSRTRPVETGISKVVFPPDSMPVIEEAARIFRETSPREEFALLGPVVKLERPDGASTGRVTVVGFIDARPSKILLELDEADYQKALRAHASQSSLSCLGLLYREGRGYILKTPHSVAIEA